MSTTPHTATTPVQDVPASALILRPSDERGKGEHGWLKTRLSFSFADYIDRDHVHFEALRVINDDWIAPRGSFPPHPHRDFEIFSYVLKGKISHEDSMGNGSTVSAGGIQYMTAGSGVVHSETNPSGDDPLELLQIWLIPAVRGAKPRYETKTLSNEDKDGKLALFISEDGRDDTIRTLAPAEIYAGLFTGDQQADFVVRPGRRAYVHIARGSASVNGKALGRGDALKVMEPGRLTITNGEDAEIVLFDLARVS